MSSFKIFRNKIQNFDNIIIDIDSTLGYFVKDMKTFLSKGSMHFANRTLGEYSFTQETIMRC